MGKNLHHEASYTNFSFAPHRTKRVRFGAKGVRDNCTLEGLEEADTNRPEMLHDVTRQPPSGDKGSNVSPDSTSAEDQKALETQDNTTQQEASAPSSSSTEPKSSVVRSSPDHYVDARGRVYKLDSYGNIIRKTNRPYGVPQKDWKKAKREV